MCLAAAQRSLTPSDISQFARAQRIIGLALAACEKTVQTIYEHSLRPIEKQHQPWTDRIGGQFLAAYRLLGGEISSAEAWLLSRMRMCARRISAAKLFSKDCGPVESEASGDIDHVFRRLTCVSIASPSGFVGRIASASRQSAFLMRDHPGARL